MDGWTDGSSLQAPLVINDKTETQEEKRFAPVYTAMGDSGSSLSPHLRARSLPLTKDPSVRTSYPPAPYPLKPGPYFLWSNN